MCPLWAVRHLLFLPYYKKLIPLIVLKYSTGFLPRFATIFPEPTSYIYTYVFTIFITCSCWRFPIIAFEGVMNLAPITHTENASRATFHSMFFDTRLVPSIIIKNISNLFFSEHVRQSFPAAPRKIRLLSKLLIFQIATFVKIIFSKSFETSLEFASWSAITFTSIALFYKRCFEQSWGSCFFTFVFRKRYTFCFSFLFVITCSLGLSVIFKKLSWFLCLQRYDYLWNVFLLILGIEDIGINLV